MFEQASIDTRGIWKSPWAMMASLSAQTIAVGAVFLFSLIRTDALPRGFSITKVAPPGAPSKPPSRPAGSTAAPARRTSPHALLFPTRFATMRQASADSEQQLLTPDGDSSGAGSIGGVDLGSGDSLLIGGNVRTPPPPPPAVQPAHEKSTIPVEKKPVPVSSGVQAAKLIRQAKPVYPPPAIQAHISGTVRLMAIIGRDGGIQNLQVVSGHPLLTPAAIEAVRHWRYQPTLLNHEPVEVITQIDVNFTLSR